MNSTFRRILGVALAIAALAVLVHIVERQSDTTDRRARSAPSDATPANPAQGEAGSRTHPDVADSRSGGSPAIDPDPTWRVAAREFSYGARWSSTPIPECVAFREWTTRFQAALSTEAREAATAEGLRLAVARRAVLRRMIEHDPEAALAATIPAAVRQELPAAVQAELEQRVAGRGLLAVVPREPPAEPDPASAPAHPRGEDRFAFIEGRTFRAHVYSRRSAQATEEGASLHGIALDGHLALHASPLRLLEPGETPATPPEPLDPLTGEPAVPSGQTSENAPRLVAFHGRTWSVADAASLSRLEAGLRALETGVSPMQPDFVPGSLPEPRIEAAAPIPWTTGTKRLLVLRVDFSDKTGEPVDRYSGARMTPSFISNVMNNQVRPFYVAQSYNQTSFTTTVSSRVYRMPKTAAAYATEYDLTGLYNDAVARAANDHKADNYDLVQLAFSFIGPDAITGSKFSFAGVAFRGGKQSFINGYYRYSVVAHELGHNYGLAHANLWRSYYDPLSDSGTSEEYGDTYDMMGGAGPDYDLSLHFNPWYKNELGWIPDSAVATATSSGTYRIHRFDHQNAPRSQPLALNIFRDGFRSYWISNRRSASGAMATSACVHWGFYGMQDSLLLDVNTPGYGLSDAGLTQGASLHDTGRGVSIRLASLGGASPSEYMDVQVTLAPPARNTVVHWGEDDAVVYAPDLTDIIAIAAGDEHGLALRRNRTLVTWGDTRAEGSNSFGELDIPYYALGEITSITAGGDSSGVIRADGTVVVWGASEYGQNAIPAGLGNVKQLSLGGTHAIALRHDGTIAVWGMNDAGQISVPAGLGPVRAVSAGRDMSVILLEDGTVQHWGVNAASKPASLSGVVAVAAGWGHGLALRSNGTVVAWGENGDGQATVPAGLNNVKQIGAGHRHSVALRTDGTVVAWGNNELRQATVPRGLPKIDTIAVAENHVIALVPGTNVPVFLQMPLNQNVTAGTLATFWVQIESPLPTIYRWQRLPAGSTTWVDLADTAEYSGTDQYSLSVQTSYRMNGDQFRCVATSESGSSATSSSGTLSVTPRPLTIATSPRDREVVLGGGCTYVVSANGEPPLTYAWQTAALNSESWTTITDGTSFTGAATERLSVTASSASLANSRFRCQISDALGQVVSSDPARLRLTLPAPTVEYGAPTAAPTLGGSATLRAPGGIPDAAYLWRKDGVALASGATLTLADLQAGDSGWYHVEVTDVHGATVTSRTFRLDVQPAQRFARLRLDPGFRPVFEKAGAVIVAIAPAPDGGVFIAGDFAAVNGRPAAHVARLLPDGTLDTRFRAPAFSGGDVFTLALQADGRLLVAGNFTAVGGTARGRMVRLLQDGRVDPSFDVGSGFDRAVRALAIQRNGQILVGGEFFAFQQQERRGLVRLQGDGSMDATFASATPLQTEDPAVRALRLVPDGTILVGRHFPAYSYRSGAILRLLPDGTQDMSFAYTGYCNSLVDLAVQDDGRILVAGNDRSDYWVPLLRLHADGSRDGSFQLAAGPSGEPTALSATAAGVFLACRQYGVSDSKPRLAQLGSDGSILPSFGVIGGFNGAVHAIVPRPEGGVLVGGEFTAWDHLRVASLAQFTGDARLVESYPAQARLAGVVHGVVTLGNGDIVAAGDFTHVNGAPRENLVRLDGHGRVVEAYPRTAGFDRPVLSLAPLPGDGVLAAGAFTRFGEAAVNGVAEISGTGLLQAYSELSELGAGQNVRSAILLHNGSRQLAGDLRRTSPAFQYPGLIRVLPTGRIDLAADLPYVRPDMAWALLEQADGKLLVAGAQLALGTSASLRLARLHADGTEDTGFVCREFGYPERITTLAPCNDGGVIAAGEINLTQGFLRVLRGAEADPRFQPQLAVFDGFVHAVQAEGDTSLLAAGAFSTHGERATPHLARLLRSGALDPDFEVVGLRHQRGSAIRALRYLADGSLLAAGSWLSFDHDIGCGLVRLVGAGDVPVIVQAPEPTAVTAGDAITLTATGQGEGPLTYQWQLDGVDIPGATGAALQIASAQAFHAGTYTVRVSTRNGSVTSAGATVGVAAPPASPARLMNLSTRALGQTGDNQLIPGFVLTGSGTKRMLVRAVGPGLFDTFTLPGYLADPRVSLHDQESGAEVAVNGDWGTSENKDAIVATTDAVGAFPLLEGSRDAALLLDLPPGAYTAPTVDTQGGSGLAMVELYDADFDSSSCQLVNISNRGFVDVGDRIMIPGFVVSAEGSRTFLIRAIGPGLTSTFGLGGVLPNPMLTVFREAEPILSNDDWDGLAGSEHTAAVAVVVGAFPLERGSADAAFVVSLPPGAYTVQAAGRDGTTGIALVEVYLVP